jgi:hypothetical protein
VVFPSWHDTKVFVVAEDGTRHLLEGVSSITWSVGPNREPAAIVQIEGVTIDVESLPTPADIKQLEADIRAAIARDD